MKYIIYVIANNQGKIYIGQTADIKKRMQEHNETGTGYTSKYRPWRLIYTEVVNTRSEAMAREKFLKTGRGRDLIKKIMRA